MMLTLRQKAVIKCFEHSEFHYAMGYDSMEEAFDCVSIEDMDTILRDQYPDQDYQELVENVTHEDELD